MKILLRELKFPESDEVYRFFQDMPKEENGFGNFGNGLSRDEFDEVVKKRIARSEAVPSDDVVPDTTYLLFIDDECVGFGKLRHCLNEKLRKIGGHIGYGIAPAYRGKGYGNILLQGILKEAENKNIDRVMLTCNVNNIASYKIMEKNGGILEKTDGDHRHYWIDLKDKFND